jgi:O-antigen/teichoic acid export membrane protein
MDSKPAPDPGQDADVVVSSGGLTLRSLAKRGALWSLVAFGGSQLLRFVGNLILTRLLFEEAFGVMALVTALLQGLQLFSDVGIGPSIIQSARGDDRDFLNTAWTVQAIRGFILWIASCLVAAPFAAFYGEPVLAWIVPVSGLTALIAGFNSTRLFSMYRHVQLSRVALVEVGSQAVGLVVMVTWALVDRSIWSLVAGGLAGAFTRLVMSHTVVPGISNRLRWDRNALGQMMSFGRWIFFSTILTFLVGQSDRLIFGKMIPIATLGVYGVASMIATMPTLAIGRVAHSVFFPIYSRVHNAGERLGGVFARARRPLLLVAGWMISGLIGGGQAAVNLLYDRRYADAGWIVQLLALGSWFAVLESTNGAALLARGEANWTAASNGGKFVGMLLLIPLGYSIAGFQGAVVGLVASEVLKYAVSAWAAVRADLEGWPQDLRLTGWVFATASLGYVTAEIAARDGASRVVVACLVFLVVTLAWAPTLLTYLSGTRSAAQLRASA